MTSLIRGFDESLRDSIKTIGPDTIFVAKFSAVSSRRARSFQELIKRPNMMPEDAEAIERGAPSIEAVVGHPGPGRRQRTDVRTGNQKTKPMPIIGVDDNYPRMARLPVEIGRFFNATEVAAAQERGRARPGAVQGAVSRPRSDRQEDSRRPGGVRGHRRAGQAADARRASTWAPTTSP